MYVMNTEIILKFDEKTGKPYVPNFRSGDLEFRSSFPLFSRIKGKDPERYYEIVKWEVNGYYGRESEYERYTEGGRTWYCTPGLGFCKIDEGCFKNPESCYTIAFFRYDEHEGCYDLESVGERIVGVAGLVMFKDVLEYGFEGLRKLRETERENEDSF